MSNAQRRIIMTRQIIYTTILSIENLDFNPNSRYPFTQLISRWEGLKKPPFPNLVIFKGRELKLCKNVNFCIKINWDNLNLGDKKVIKKTLAFLLQLRSTLDGCLNCYEKKKNYSMHNAYRCNLKSRNFDINPIFAKKVIKKILGGVLTT